LPRRDDALAAAVLQDDDEVDLISCEQLDLAHLFNQVRITRSGASSVSAHEPLAHILRVKSTVPQRKYALRPRYLSALLAPLDTVIREPAQRESDTRLNDDRQQPALRGREREGHGAAVHCDRTSRVQSAPKFEWVETAAL